MQKFIHAVSKGTRFNQIYIPKEWNDAFEPGDEVEVRLVRKGTEVYSTKYTPRLTPFKEKLAREIFSILSGFPAIRQAFIFGSFITQLVGFRDIDVLAVVDGPSDLKNKIEEALQRAINLQFHCITVAGDRFENLRKSCPLIRNMLLSCISNKPIRTLPPQEVDKGHIKFLLMMPEDILEITVGSRVYYDNLRRLIVIENFLDGKEAINAAVQAAMEKLLTQPLISMLKENDAMDSALLEKVREKVREKIAIIGKLLEVR